MTRCSVTDCERQALSRGWCVVHYARWRKHGTTDLHVRRSRWDDFRELTDIDTDDCIEWPYAHVKGYGRIGNYLLTRNVCFANFGEPPTPRSQAAHSCGNPPCINWRHLRWATAIENAADRWSQGTMRTGEALHCSKLTEANVLEVRRRVAAGETQTSLAHEFNVHVPAINRIVHRKRWGWLADPTDNTQPTSESEPTP